MRQQFRILNALATIALVAAHARLIDPPSRSSMWRFGFNTPVNYNDNELFCGGLSVQYYTNHGRCGVCGDDFNLPQPRPNEAGGKYAKGIIVRTYLKGQIINVTVEVTANHLGYFVFYICPHNNPKKIVSQECLDKYPLRQSDRTYRYYVKPAYLGFVTIPVMLPEDVTCTQCVLQWQYKGENNWGRCRDGKEGLGCGPQENFRACADVAITGGDIQLSTETASPHRTTQSSSIHPDMATSKQMEIVSNPSTSTEMNTPAPSSNKIHSTRATQTSADDSFPSVWPTADNRIFKQDCKGIPNMLSAVPGLDYWCQANCVMGNCPHNLCQC